jgi:putative addiction module component (TIGR02574 family)
MTGKAEIVLKEALDLEAEERAQLADALFASLEPTPDAEVEAAWRGEVERRVAALDAGEVDTVPWHEVRDQLYARLSAARPR